MSYAESGEDSRRRKEEANLPGRWTKIRSWGWGSKGRKKGENCIDGLGRRAEADTEGKEAEEVVSG